MHTLEQVKKVACDQLRIALGGWPETLTSSSLFRWSCLMSHLTSW